MARKTSTYTVTTEGRDLNKAFLLTEMAATRAEDWAIRCILALGAANVDIPEGAMELGMAALAEVGLKKLFSLSPLVVKPLLDELMECVQIQPDRKRPEVKRAVMEGDIEEVRTLLTLKWEVLKLHLDFTLGEGLSSSLAEKLTPGHKPPTKTSHASSGS